MNTLAVVLERPEHLAWTRLELTPAGAADVVVEIAAHCSAKTRDTCRWWAPTV